MAYTYVSEDIEENIEQQYGKINQYQSGGLFEYV